MTFLMVSHCTALCHNLCCPFGLICCCQRWPCCTAQLVRRVQQPSTHLVCVEHTCSSLSALIGMQQQQTVVLLFCVRCLSCGYQKHTQWNLAGTESYLVDSPISFESFGIGGGVLCSPLVQSVNFMLQCHVLRCGSYCMLTSS